MKTLWKTLLAAGAIALATQANAVTFTVDAKADSASGAGLNTAITLSAGESLSISVDPNDLWSAGALPRWSNANGLIANLYATGSDESGQAAGTLIGIDFGLYPPLTLGTFSAPYGTLVGRIDGGAFFKAGTSYSGVADSSGVLRLFYWDENSGDNSGSVSVTVNVPEGGLTTMLLGMGLMALALVRRMLK